MDKTLADELAALQDALEAVAALLKAKRLMLPQSPTSRIDRATLREAEGHVLAAGRAIADTRRLAEPPRLPGDPGVAGSPAEALQEAARGQGKNRCRCRRCGSIIESKHRHDFIRCACGAIFTDGGRDYVRRGGNPEDIEDMP